MVGSSSAVHFANSDFSWTKTAYKNSPGHDFSKILYLLLQSLPRPLQQSVIYLGRHKLVQFAAKSRDLPQKRAAQVGIRFRGHQEDCLDFRVDGAVGE